MTYQLTRMKELDAARTQGEWIAGQYSDNSFNVHADDLVCRLSVGGYAGKNTACDNDEANAAFIAAASTFVPWAVNEIERLTALCDAQHRIINDLSPTPDDTDRAWAREAALTAKADRLVNQALKERPND